MNTKNKTGLKAHSVFGAISPTEAVTVASAMKALAWLSMAAGFVVAFFLSPYEEFSHYGSSISGFNFVTFGLVVGSFLGSSLMLIAFATIIELLEQIEDNTRKTLEREAS